VNGKNQTTDYGLLRQEGTTLLFETNGGHAYLRQNHKSQGDNTATFGSSSPPPTLLEHRPDLPLFSDMYKVGFGLWNFPLASLVLEAAITLGGIFLYFRSTSASSFGGRYGMLLFFLIMLLFQIVMAMLPLPPSPRPLVLIMLVFYLGSAGIAFWIEKKRQ
jgi:hypothetical protein